MVNRLPELPMCFLKALNENIPLKGNPNQSSILAKSLVHGAKDAILCRTNATAMSHLLDGLKAWA